MSTAPVKPLVVSRNRRYLVQNDGKETPFFYLGDTAWELFHRLTLAEAQTYLKDRAAKGFTVIQAVALAEFDGLTEPNRNGDLPLAENDPTRPNEAYFRHVDAVVDAANALGLTVGFLPSWGDKVNPKWAKGPVIFTPENARVYGEFLGRRYREKNIIWIVGGDRPVDAPEHAAVWRAIAAGLKRGDEGRNLVTFHPMGGRTSASDFHGDDWLDFNMIQSGHSERNIANHEMIARDYARTPVKPCMDSEPCYEDHPVNWKAENGYFDEYDVRKAAYWAVFAGAHGHAYGCHDIWQFYDPACHAAVAAARTPWQKAVDLPAAGQMRHLRTLLESRTSYTGRIPDQGILASDAGTGGAHVRATRDEKGRYALLYTPLGEPLTVRLDKIGGATGAKYRAGWFDPRTGESHPIDVVTATGERAFTPPSRGENHDWVLTLDADV